MSEHKIVDRARGRWREILPALGVDSRLLDGKQHACPICNDGKDRFRFDDKGGAGTWFCNRQHGTEHDNSMGSAGNGFALIMDTQRVGFAEAARLVETIIGTDSTPKAPSPASPSNNEAAEAILTAKNCWRQAVMVSPGDPVDLYLRRRVGQYMPTRAIRYLPETDFGDRVLPAMISAFVDVHGDLYGVQRTFLTADGQKAGVTPDRINSGRLPEGGAVRLAKHEKLLGVAEGVETALSASAMWKLPCWSALNEGRLSQWKPPEGVTEVIVFGDNDPNYVGQAAAFMAARRLVQEAKRDKRDLIVQVKIPEELKDWNDVLVAQRAGGMA